MLKNPSAMSRCLQGEIVSKMPQMTYSYSLPHYCIGLIFKFGDLLWIKMWMTRRWRDTVNKTRIGNLGLLYICLKDIRVAEILTK